MAMVRRLMVALGECNFYGALGVLRVAVRDADELKVGGQVGVLWVHTLLAPHTRTRTRTQPHNPLHPQAGMDDLMQALAGGVQQIASAVAPGHSSVENAMREFQRWVGGWGWHADDTRAPTPPLPHTLHAG